MTKILTDLSYTQQEIDSSSNYIYDEILEKSHIISKGNFERIGTFDLQILFDLYDTKFFDNRLKEKIEEFTGYPFEISIEFAMSRRMTKSAGLTKLIIKSRGTVKERRYFQIKISSYLLYQSFADIKREIVVVGIKCEDRLQTLQRVFEHELIHLLEMLVYKDSNCKHSRFAKLANNIFGHTHHQHQLITQNERAQKKYDLQVGDWVKFNFEGQKKTGFIDRITKRATVLVLNSKGDFKKHGSRYDKFYIPLPHLTKLSGKSKTNRKRKT